MQAFVMLITPLMLTAAIWLVLRTSRDEEEELDKPSRLAQTRLAPTDPTRPRAR